VLTVSVSLPPSFFARLPAMRILSYNIQAAIAADSYLSYLTRLHRQVLPGAAKERTLSRSVVICVFTFRHVSCCVL